MNSLAASDRRFTRTFSDVILWQCEWNENKQLSWGLFRCNVATAPLRSETHYIQWLAPHYASFWLYWAAAQCAAWWAECTEPSNSNRIVYERAFSLYNHPLKGFCLPRLKNTAKIFHCLSKLMELNYPLIFLYILKYVIIQKHFLGSYFYRLILIIPLFSDHAWEPIFSRGCHHGYGHAHGY